MEYTDYKLLQFKGLIEDSILDGGAKGKFFEKVVTYHLKKDRKINQKKKKKND